jgi:hypothetical protein
MRPRARIVKNLRESRQLAPVASSCGESRFRNGAALVDHVA